MVRKFRRVKNVAHANGSGRCLASITGHQTGELLERDNLTADKPFNEIVMVYRRASTCLYTEMSSTFTPCHRKYGSSIQAAKVGYCKYPLLTVGAHVPF